MERVSFHELEIITFLNFQKGQPQNKLDNFLSSIHKEILYFSLLKNSE